MEIINVSDEIIEINVTEEVINIVTQTGAYPLPSNVISVFGRVGNVVGQVGDYTTSIVGEGTNLYYTNARSRAAISETITGINYDNTSGIFSMASGYAIATTASQATWDAAYNDKINSASVTGTSTKTLTLNQQDGGTITASWTDDNTDAVTSVFGRTGAVIAANGDYNTSQVTENTNLYFTNARSRSAISETITGIDYDNTSGIFSLASGYVIPTQASLDAKQDDLNGTGIVKSTAGTISYLTDNTANWDAAYNDKINSASVTGTSTKTLTLNQQDGGTITASWTDENTGGVTSVFGRTGVVVATEGDYTLTQLGDVTLTSPASGQVLKYNGTAWVNGTDTDTGLTSVGLSMPAAFSVSGSPLINNGTISVTGAGSSSQYVRGDGSLANFPTSTGGGSSVAYYFNSSVSQGTLGGVAYRELSKVPIIGAGTDLTIAADGYIASYITDAGDPALLEIPAGNWNFEMYFSSSSSGGTPSFYVELYKYNGTTFTLISSSSATPEGITNGTAIDIYTTALAVPSTILTLTDRLAIRVYVTHSGKTITLHTENSHLCEVITTFSRGISALNGLTNQVQYLATGTTGTDFNISSATDTHTFNLPTASGTNTGKLSSSDWTIFNNKQPLITAGTTAQYYRGDKTFQTLDTLAVPENTNLYYTSARFDTAFSGKSTTNLTEGTNLYYTEARVDANTNVSANTAARHAAVTIGTANGLSLSTQVLSLALASTSTTGALSSTDFTTFNNKQGTLTLTTTGTSGAATLVGDTLNIPQYSGGGGGGMAIGGSITSATAGSVLFAGASGVLAQDNANFFWDDTNNRLGLGTTSPVWMLELNKNTTSASAGVYPAISINNPNAAGYTGIYMYQGTTQKGYFEFSNGSGAFNMNSPTTLNLQIATATKLSINSSGFTGLNTTTIGSQLQVNGSAAIGYSASTAAPTNGLAVSGNLGVGIAAPTEKTEVSGTGDIKLKVSTTSTGSGANASLQLNATTEGGWILQTGNAGVGALRFVDTIAGVDRMRIFSNGNVGINTTTGGSKLQVNGNVAIGYSASTAAPTNGLAVAGTSTFADNVTVSKNQNAITTLTISNTTVGSGASAEFYLTSSGGNGVIGKNSSGRSTYKNLLPSDFIFYNGTSGNFSFLNDHASGGFSIITGASSSAQFTIASTGAVTMTNDVAISGVLIQTITTNRQTASYTLVLADRGKLVEMNVATANNLTIPLNSSVAFPIGTQIDLSQYGAGQTTVVATGGVTIRSTNSWVKLNAQYAAATLIKIGTDEWYLFGNLNA